MKPREQHKPQVYLVYQKGWCRPISVENCCFLADYHAITSQWRHEQHALNAVCRPVSSLGLGPSFVGYTYDSGASQVNGGTLDLLK